MDSEEGTLGWTERFFGEKIQKVKKKKDEELKFMKTKNRTAQREWRTTFKMLKENNFQSNILYLDKLLIMYKS